MSWLYSQSTGKLSHPDGLSFACYSGHGVGKNNPDLQHVHDVGPIPRGHYTMTGVIEHHPDLGPYVIILEPDEANEMFGRGDFRIHGDSIAEPGNASHGCIIKSPKLDRMKIWNHGDRELEVV